MQLSPKQYAIILYNITSGRKQDLAAKAIGGFARLLSENNDSAKLNRIIFEFNKIWNSEQNIIEADITTAIAMGGDIQQRLKGYLKTLTRSKQVLINEKLDKNILGGAIIQYGDRVIDASLRSKLNQLGQEMKK